MKTIPKPRLRRRLSRHAFKAWLSRKRPTTTVGERSRSRTCPIATFCGKGTVVNSQCLKIGGKIYGLPQWAQDFVYILDGGSVNTTLDDPVTAKEALEVLEQLT